LVGFLKQIVNDQRSELWGHRCPRSKFLGIEMSSPYRGTSASIRTSNARDWSRQGMGGVTNRDRGRRALPAGIPQATNCHPTRTGGRYELQSCLICRRTPNPSHRDDEAAKEGTNTTECVYQAIY